MSKIQLKIKKGVMGDTSAMTVVKRIELLFEGKPLTVIMNSGEIWFKAIDVATALEYLNTKNAIIRHVPDED